MSLLLVSLLPVSLGCINLYMDSSTKDGSLHTTIDATAAVAATIEEDSSDSDSTTATTTATSPAETKEMHYVDTEH